MTAVNEPEDETPIADRLAVACDRFKSASEEYAAATQGRARTIREAFDAGLDPDDIARIVGVTRTRAYWLARQSR